MNRLRDRIVETLFSPPKGWENHPAYDPDAPRGWSQIGVYVAVLLALLLIWVMWQLMGNA